MKTHEEIKEFLIEKIREGEEKFLTNEVKNKFELDQLKNDYQRWKSYNNAYLESAFSNDRFSCDYKNSYICLDIITFNTPFSKHFEDFKDEVNSNIQVLKEIFDKLPLYKTQEKNMEEQMNYLAFCTDRVSVLRTDGFRYQDVPAQVNSKMILIPDVNIPIELNDVISRSLPSGIEEKFIVTDPGFINNFKGIPAHYEIKFRREGREAIRQGYTVINNIHGDNPRVNIDSLDNSKNSINHQYNDINIIQLAKELTQLREALLLQARTSEHYSFIRAVASAEQSAEAENFSTAKESLSKLGTGAQWVLDIAKEIGVQVAIAAITKAYFN